MPPAAVKPVPYRAEQLELPLMVMPSPSFKVTRVENHIVLTPRPLEAWGSTKDAALVMRRSDRFVRMMAEAGTIPARRLPGSKKWEIDLIELQRWIDSGRNAYFSA